MKEKGMNIIKDMETCDKDKGDKRQNKTQKSITWMKLMNGLNDNN